MSWLFAGVFALASGPVAEARAEDEATESPYAEVDANDTSVLEADASPTTSPPPALLEPVDVVVHGRRTYAAERQTTATRGESDVRDVPQSITVVSRDFMDDVQARRTDDVLQYVPGVQLNSGYGGTWDDYSVRGFRVWAGTTYRNGYFAGYSSANAADAINVERIEVLRGPASALYGPALPGGAINYVTKRPLSHRRLEVGVYAGSFDTTRLEIDATGPLSDDRAVRHRVLAALESTSGYRDFNDYRRAVLNPVVEIDLGDRTTLLVEVQGYQQGYRADPRGLPVLGDDPNALPLERSFADPTLPLARLRGGLMRFELTHRLAPRWSVRAGSQSSVTDYQEQTLIPLGIDAETATMSRLLLDWYSDTAATAIQLGLTGAFDTGPVGHDVVVGSDVSGERVGWKIGFSDPGSDPYPIHLHQPTYGAPLPDAPFLPGPKNRWAYRAMGLYAHDRLTLWPQLKLVLGGRVDTYHQRSVAFGASDEIANTFVTGRAAVVLQPLEPLTFYASVSNGVWPVLGIAADGGVLEAERSFGLEAGSRVALPDGALEAELSVFRILNRNVAVADPANPDFQVQRGEAKSRGIEARVGTKPVRWFRLWASYAYTDAFVSDDPDPSLVGTPLPLTALHSGGSWAQLEVPTTEATAVSVGAGAVYAGERTLLDYSTIPGYARADAALGFSTRTLRTLLRVENVLGARYLRSGTDRLGVLPGAPRSVMLSAHLSL